MHPISYAQNGEDIILQRALSDIDKGFYIDIGAFDPLFDSVTKAFYELGWSGINIEPVPQFYTNFVRDRPRDLNLNLAVGKDPGLFSLSLIEGTGLSTFNETFAQRHSASGYSMTKILVSTVTGNDIFSKIEGRVVHFLKVDVEGSEKDVFESIDLRKYRPWIVLAEATEPNSQNRADAEWSPILKNNGYELVYFDGLNTYYLAEEHLERRSELAKQPNIFDNFVTYDKKLINDRLVEECLDNQKKQTIIDSCYKEIDLLSSKLINIEAKIEGFAEQISALRNEIIVSNEAKKQLETKIAAQSVEIVNLISYIDKINS